MWSDVSERHALARGDDGGIADTGPFRWVAHELSGMRRVMARVKAVTAVAAIAGLAVPALVLAGCSSSSADSSTSLSQGTSPAAPTGSALASAASSATTSSTTGSPTTGSSAQPAQSATAPSASSKDGVSSTSASANMLPTKPGPFRLAGVTKVTQVAQLTGPDSMNKTDRFFVAGQDLGSMFQANGKTWFVFGDTFGQRDEGMTGGGGTGWRSNTMAYTTDTDPSNGITFDGYIVDSTGWAQELISAKQVDDVEMTVIPTYGFAANGAMYLDYMSVKHWGDPGEWETNYSGLAKSADGGQTWTKLDSPKWPGNSNFIQVSVTNIGGELYFWGVTHGRFGGVALMKVAEADVEQQSGYEYFTGTAADGTPQWSSDMKQAKVIVDSTVGELSVVWNDYLQRWLMTYTDGGGDGADIREAAAPWGPWSDAMTLVSAADVPGLYAPYMLPAYTANGGRTIYFTLSIWDPYNVFWYRADLVERH